MADKTALITGASSGIGLELAKLFAKDGYRLVLVARSQDKLEALNQELGGRHQVLAKDLKQPSAPREIYEAVRDVDVLVNNAGFTVYGEFTQTSWDAEAEMLQVNMVALTELTKRFLPGMVGRKSGRILNVASTAAFQPGPLMACYYATKAYVLSFSEAIANELEGTGVTVTALCPGATDTGFVARGQVEDSKLFKGRVADARVVAEEGYHALMKGQGVYIQGCKNQVMALSVRFAPRGVVTRIVRAMQEKSKH
ncbi:MAG: SDR family NAD(P)-dependent oxidoreductase [Candidatus Xenobia bacterium]